MGRTIDFRVRRLGILNQRRWIKHAQPEACREQAFERPIDVFFRYEALLDGIHIFHVIGVIGNLSEKVSTLVIHPRLDCKRAGVYQAFRILMPHENILDRTTVRHYVPIKFPGTPQLVFEQERVNTGGLTVHPIVSAHNRPGMAFDHGSTEGRQVRVLQVVFRYWHIHAMTGRLWAAMHGKMFGCRDHAVIIRIITLESAHKGDAHLAGQKWIFAISFLAATPAGIAKDIDIRRPEVQTLHNVAMSGPYRLIMLGAGLSADHYRHVVNKRSIESCRQPDGLRKYRSGSSSSHAVQSLAPPVVGKHMQPGDGARLVDELRGFFLQRHT